MFCATNNISVNYNNYSVLKNITVEILLNKTTAIVGKNGSGKTTLLRCINCLLKPHSGSIRHKFNYPFPMLFQTPAKFQNSVQYNFEILCKIKKMKPSYKWFNSFHLSRIKNKYINEVSGGEKQKIYLSRIMSIDSDIIIMDEPNQNLDIESDNKFLELMLEEKNKDKTIIFSSHDFAIVKKIADQIIYLDNGTIIYDGIPKEHI